MQLFNWARWLRSLVRPKGTTYRRQGKRNRLAFDVLESRIAPTTWQGTSSALWSVGANWVGSSPPGAGASLVFNSGPTQLTTTDNIAGGSFNSLTFGGTGYTVAPSPLTNTLTLTGSSAITVNNGVTTTSISSDIDFANASFESAITLGTGTTLTLSGQISDAPLTSLTVNGPGILILSGNNSTFTGTIDVTGGATLEIENANALGSASVTVASGSGLEIVSPSSTTFSNALILNGGGPSGPGTFSTGALINSSAAGTTINWSGTVSLDSNTTISDITTSILDVSGVISDQGVQNLTKQGTGEVIFAGSNSYGGAGSFTTVENGILDIQNSNGLGAGGQFVVVNYDTVNTQEGTLQLDDPGSTASIAASSGAVESGNTVTITTTTPHGFTVGQTVTIAGVTTAGYNGTYTITSVPTSTSFTYTDPTSSLATSGAGTATVYNGLLIADQTLQIYGPGPNPGGGLPSLYNHAGNNVWAGNIQFLANAGNWITVNASTNLTVSGDPGVDSSAITGSSGTFTKNGTGTLIFTTPNTYTITTTVAQGILQIEDSDALGTNSTIVDSGATLELAGGLFSRELLMLGTNGQELSPIVSTTIDGYTFPLFDDSVTGTTDSMQVFTTLNINGAGATVEGSTVGALWSFSGINTYTGPITLQAGSTTAIGVELPGTNDDPDTVTASPFNFDILPNGLASDDTLTITDKGLSEAGGTFQKVGLGQLILPSPNPGLLDNTQIVAGWITIGTNGSLAAYVPADSINAQPYDITVDQGGGLFLLPLSATAQDEQQTVTLIGDTNTSDQFDLYFEGFTVTLNVGATAAQVQTALATLPGIGNVKNVGVTLDTSVPNRYLYTITFENTMSATFEPQIIASSVSLASGATITSNITVAGSGGDLSLGQTLVVSGTGPTMPYILSNLPGYDFVGDSGGAVMNLAGVNNIFGNVELASTASVGVEQAYSSDPANSAYSPNYLSQLTTTGPISQVAVGTPINVTGQGSGNEHETDQVINVGSTTGIATIDVDTYKLPDDVRVYYGDYTTDPTGAVLLYDSSSAAYPAIPYNITSASDSAAKVVTIVTSAANGFYAGESVTIAGVGNHYNGTFTIASILSPTSFTYSINQASLATITNSGTAIDGAPNNPNGAQIVVNYNTTTATTAVTEASEFGGTVGTGWDGAGGVWVAGSPGPTVNYNASFTQIEIIINQVVDGVGNTNGSSAWKDSITVVPGVVVPNYGITKIGSQRLILESVGTYSGPVDIQQGVVLVQNASGLGTAPISTVDITSASEAGSTVTVTTAANHGFSVGEQVDIAGMSIAGYDGTFTIATIPTNTTFTFTDSTTGLGAATKGTATGVVESTTTVEAGAALELANTLPQFNGGIAEGLQILEEQLILRGTGDPVFGDAPLTILSAANPSYIPPVNDTLISATDQLWQGPVSLDTYATSFSVTLPSTNPLYALTGTGTNGLAFSTLSLELGGTLAAGDTFDLIYNGMSQQVVWTSNAPTLTSNIQIALNALFPTNTPTVTALAANTYNFTFPSTTTFTPLTFGTDATSGGLTVTPYQVLTFGGNLQDGESFSLGYGPSTTSFLWSSNVTTLTSNIQIALNQLFPGGSATDSAIASIGASGTTGYGVIDVPAGNRLTFAGVINDTANPDPNGSDIIVYGNGDGASASSELVLAGNNTYRGSTDALPGVVLVVENNSALGQTGITEEQTITVPNTDHASLTLTFNGFSATVPYSSTPATEATDIAMDLNALNSVNGVGGSVTVSSAVSGSSEVYTVTFGGTFLGFNEPLIGAAGPVSTAMLADGGGGTEVASGASLEIAGNLTVAAEPVEIAGNGVQTLTPVPTQWFQLGPSPILGSGDNSDNQDSAGQVTSISYDPTDSTGNTIFVTTADGGAWETLNGGQTWEQLFDYYNPSYSVNIMSAAAAVVGATQTVTITTTAPHGFSVGQEVTIANMSVAAYDGTYTIASVPNSTEFTYSVTVPSALGAATGGTATYNAPEMSDIASVTEVGTTATVTTTAAHSFLVGQQVVISGVSVAGYNGTFEITAVTSTTFSYTTTAGLSNVTTPGGTASLLTPIFAGYIVAAAVTPGTMPNTTFPYVLYLGTGEADNAANSFYGSGVYESLNGGQTWSLLTQTATAYAGNNPQIAVADSANPLGYAGTTVSKIVVDPNDASTIYVAVSDLGYTGVIQQTPDDAGIWKYSTSARTWVSLTNPLTSTISSIAVAAGTVTVTTSTALSLTVGQKFSITGDSNAADNVVNQTVTNVGINSLGFPYFTFTDAAVVADANPAAGTIVTVTPATSSPAEGGHPSDIEQTSGTETLFVTFGASPTSITASGITLSATPGGVWSLAFSNMVQGNSFTLTIVYNGNTYTTGGIVWSATPATLETSITNAINAVVGIAPSFQANVTITLTTTNNATNPQYFNTGQPLELLEAQSNVGAQNQEFAPTSVNSTQVIYANSTWGLYDFTGTLTGYDYNVYFDAESEDYSDLWVYVDPSSGFGSGSNRIIEFAQGAPGGGAFTFSAGGPNRYSNGVFISTNGGVTFQESGFQNTAGLWGPSQSPMSGVLRVAATINTTQNWDVLANVFFTFYASESTTGGGFGGMVEATISWGQPVAGAGLQWVLSEWTAPAASPNGSFMGSDGNYASAAVAEVPTNGSISPPVLFVGGIGTGVNGNFLIEESSNGGASWTDISDPLTNGPSSAVYTMTVEMVSNVPEYLLVGTDSGIWRYNLSTSTWSDLNGNLDTAQFNSIAISPNNNSEIGLALGAVIANGAIETSGSPQWTYVDPATGTADEVAINPANPNDAYLLTASGSLYYSTSGGAAGSWVVDGGVPTPVSYFYLDPVDPSRMLAIGNGSLYVSTNQGSGAPSWTDIDPGASGFVASAAYQGTFQANSSFSLVVDQGANTYAPNTIYVVSAAGGVALTENGGLNWVNPLNPAPTIKSQITGETLTGTVTSLVVDPTNSYTVYVTTTTGQIWKTTDAGYNWINIGESTESGTLASNELPASPLSFSAATGTNVQVPGAAWSLALDPRSDTVVPTTFTVASVSEAGNVVSLVINSTNTGLTLGETVQVANVGLFNYDGTFFITKVTVGASSTTIQYTNSAYAGLAPSTGGALTANLGQGTLYVGTDDGVYEGVYSAATNTYTWSPLGTGLPQVQVRSIAVNEVTDTLTIGTYGRGAFTMALDGTSASSGAMTAVSGSAVWTGNVILAGATTASAEGSQLLQNGVAGAQLTIQGTIADASYDLFSSQTAVSVMTGFTIVGATETGTTASLVVNSITTGINVGDTIAVTGVPVSGYDGTFIVTAINIAGSQTTISYTASTSGLSSSTGGTLFVDAELAKSGYGNVIISGANIYTGVTNVLQGVLVSNNTDALSGTATVVDNGTSLELEASLASEAIYLFGNGIETNGHYTGALRCISGTDTYTGTITLMSNATIGVDSGATLIIGTGAGEGTITDLGLGYSVTKESAGTLEYDDPTTYGAAGAGLAGTGVTLPNGLSYASGTVVSQGILVIAFTGALGDDYGDTTAVTYTTVLDGAQVRMTGATVDENFNLTGSGNLSTGALYSISNTNTINGVVLVSQNASFSPTSTPSPTASIGVNAGSVLTINGTINQVDTTPVATITFTGTPLTGITATTTGGLVVTPSGLIKTSSGVTTSIQTLTFTGTLVGSTLTLTYNGHTATSAIPWNVNPTTLANLIQVTLASLGATTTVNFGGIDKVGQGTLILDQNVLSTGPGTTTVSAGIVELTAAANYGWIVVESGAALDISSASNIDVTATVTLNGTGVTDGALDNVLGNNSLTGDVILQTNASIGVENGLTLTVDGPVQDYTPLPTPPATLTKVGGGTLELTHTSSYTGSTFVSLGVLNVQNNTALGAAVTPQVQTVSVTGLSSASFEMSFTSASPLPAASATSSTAVTFTNFTLAAIQAVLNNLMAAVGLGGVMTVTSVNNATNTFTVQLGGTFLGFNQPNIGIVSTNLSASNVTTTTYGSGGVCVTGFGTLQLQGGVTVSNKPLLLTGTGYTPGGGSPLGALDNTVNNDTWDSQITLDGAAVAGNTVGINSSTAGATLTIDQAIGETPVGAGVQLNIGGVGTVDFTGSTSNTYTGLTDVMGGTAGAANLLLDKKLGALAIVGDLTIGTGLQAPGTTEVILGPDAQSTQLATTVNIVVNSDGIFDTDPLAQTIGEQIASLTMTGGTVILESGSTLTDPSVTATADASNNPALIKGAGTLTDTTITFTTNTNGPAFPDAVVSAVIVATTLDTTGIGVLQLTNQNHANTTNVEAGTVLADDPSSGGTTLTLGNVTLSGGTLGGTGAVGVITQSATASTIAPGDGITNLGDPFIAAPGALTETWSSATTFLANLTNPDQSGLPGTNHNWMQINGNLNIGNATLAATFSPVAAIGDQYTIIETTGTVTGTFANAPATGDIVELSGQNFIVTYNSNSVVLNFSALVNLKLLSQPTSTTAGTTINAVTVAADDASGNPVSGLTINLAINPGSLTSGTVAVTTNASGEAVFSNLLEDTAGTYSLTATASGFSGVTTNAFVISPAAASELKYVTEPGTTVAGVDVSPVTVAVADMFGNVIAQSGTVVNLSFAPGMLTTGTTTLTTNAQGEVAFTDLSEDTIGTYTLTAAAAGLSNAVSNPFVIIAAAPVSFSYLTQPSNTPAGSTINAVTLQSFDQYGNPEFGVPVSISISPGTLSSGTTPVITNASGDAVFSNLIEDTAGTYTLTATMAGIAPLSSNSFQITPLPASTFVYVTQPGNTPAGSDINAVTVQISDKFGNFVSQAGVSITIATSTGALTSGTTTMVSNAQGQAVFSNLVEDTSGTYTLVASTAGFTNATSNSFVISPTAAVGLAFESQPINTGAGNDINPITVESVDQFNNPVPGVTVSMAISPGTLTSGTTPLTTNAAGVAVFSDLTEDTLGTYSLIASASGLSNATSNTFTIIAGSAFDLVFTSEPTSTGAGASLGSVTVQVEDEFGNPVAQSGVSVSVSTSPGTLSGGTTPVLTNAQGQAVFGNLTEDTLGTYTLIAGATGMVGALSNTFTITAGSPKSLAFATQPSSVAAGSNLGQITVETADQFGNLSSQSGVVVTIALSSGTLSAGTLKLTTGANGQVVFSDLVEDTAGTYSLTATASGLTSAVSNQFVVSAALSSAKLTFVTQPGSAIAGNILSAATVLATDQYNNKISNSAVSIGITPGTLSSGTTSLTTNAAGEVVFNNLTEDFVGTYTLTASLQGGVSANSNSFTISAAAASALSFSSEPATTGAGSTLNAITVQITDKFGNPLKQSGFSVSIALAPGTFTSGTLTEASNSSGQSVFSNLVEDIAGTYSLQASASGFTSVFSNSFNVTAGAATQLIFATQPTSLISAGATLNAITVDVADKFGNAETTAGVAITMGLTPGALSSGTFIQDTNAQGQAVFGDLVEDHTGAFKLTATSTGVTSVNSNSFTVAALTPAELVFLTQPSTTIAGSKISTVTIQVADAFGNPVSKSGVVTTIGITPGTLTSGGGSLTTNSLGEVAYTSLVEATSGVYTLTASAAGLTGAQSNPFTLTSSADKLSFTVEPAGGTAGLAMSAVTVLITDPSGNPLPNVPITISIPATTLTGTTLATSGLNGQATFSNLITTKAGTYTMSAAAPGLNSVSSTAFVISAGIATSIAFVTEPVGAVAGSAMTPFTVKALDQYGNLVPGFLITLTSPAASFNGATAVSTNPTGQAIFANLSQDVAGLYTLSAGGSGVKSISSSSFTITAAGVANLTYVNQPLSTTAGTIMSNVVVKATDQFGNVVSGDVVSLYISLNTVNGITRQTTNSSGLATFSNLYITKAATNYTFSVTSGTLSKVASNPFTISPATGRFSFVTQPTSTSAGNSLGPVTVQLVDAYGNPLVNTAVTVKLSSGTLSGTLTQTVNALGEVTFGNLSVAQQGSGYTLTVSAPGVTSITSSSFSITAAAGHLAFTAPPVGSTHGTVMNAVVVQLYNANGTPLDQANVSVTIRISSGALSGTLTVLTNSSGQAMFTTLDVTAAGSYTLTATATVNGHPLSVTSGFFTVS